MTQTRTRDQIVEAADELFYTNGFEKTSFSQIAQQVGLSRGNFYYHFKTKDDILQAVIERRIVRTREMLNQWQQQGDTPRDRIRCFINILIMNRVKIQRYGCPVGTLCSELAKLEHRAQSDAARLFILFRDWLKQQFVQLGKARKADEYAMHLLAASQGIATMANTLGDEAFMKREVNSLNQWLDQCLAT